MSGHKDRGREPLITDAIGIAVGAVIVLAALGRLANPIQYLPSDPRSQPGVSDTIAVVMVLVGLVPLTIGVFRLLQGMRSRK